MLKPMDHPRDPTGALNANAFKRPHTADLGGDAPYMVIEPLRRTTPFVFASPHSGRRYPESLLSQTRLSLHSLRRSEDAYVDELFAAAAAHGAPVLCATMARTYVDLNRDPAELDPDMFHDGPPRGALLASPRVQAGLGAIPRVAGDGEEIYPRPLSISEAERRLNGVHRPYHAMLEALVAETQAMFGCAVLIDCHSMPSSARGPHAPDVVLGDRFGGSCHPELTAFIERELRALGYKVARNAPFAGGHTTQTYGRPKAGVHALQIELDRSLYLQERSLTRSSSFARVRADMSRLVEALAATADWPLRLR
jgi:N-formylglutamate amidohydrolase